MIMDEENLEKLQIEINHLKSELSIKENNFSEKRAQFKELYIKKEQELLLMKSKNSELISELKLIKDELIDVQSAAALAETIRQEELESMKQKCNEEMSTINGIMKENIDSINSTKLDLESRISKLEAENISLTNKLEEKNNELFNTNENMLVKIAQRLKLNTHEIFKGFQENSEENQEENVQKNPLSDADMLKSLVGPYEEDVINLKSKIREAYDKIDQLEASAIHAKSVNINELQQEINDFKNKLNLEKENNIFLKQSLSQINDKYFETENKLLRIEKLMTETQKMQMKTLFDGENPNKNIFQNNWENTEHSDLIKSNLRKSLSGNDIKQPEVYNVPINIARRNTDVQSLNEFIEQISIERSTNTRIISENEWSRMQLELAALKNRSNLNCEMCKNYEDQLQSVQNQLKEKDKKYNEICDENKTNLRLVNSLQESGNKLSCRFNENVATHEKLISNLANKINSLDDFCERLRSAYERFRDATDRELKQMNNERRETKLKMEKLELTYDNLLCKRIKKAIEMEAEKIELPADIESAQFLLLKLKEDLIQCRAAYEHLQESMQSSEIFSKEKAKADKIERDAFINEFNNEKKELESQIELLQSQLNKRKVVTKSSENLEETIRVLKAEIEAVKKNYGILESDNKSLKSKSQALQQELENSESVQQDFVRLSQTLQIQLEKIRQEERELRWQFEEDVTQCNDCQNDLCSTSDRKKYHCKHCGRIFCKNCLLEIPAGLHKKKANVCKVCHTFLVKEAVPYFSMNKS